MSDKKKKSNKKETHQSEEYFSERVTHHERDSSPSAMSQSSAASAILEWDPSADVGTPGSVARPASSSAQQAGEVVLPTTRGITDLSTIERMALTWSSDQQQKNSEEPSQQAAKKKKKRSYEADAEVGIPYLGSMATALITGFSAGSKKTKKKVFQSVVFGF